jgi:hypothetical protein
MFFKLDLIVSLLFATSLGKPAELNRDSFEGMTCKKVFQNRGIENIKDFALAAAHGSHSLYLEELRHFFEASTSEQNRIPILNFDISDSEVIWPNSRLAGYDDTLMR